MPFDLTTLDGPFVALKAFDWGGDAAPLAAIDAAVIAAHGDAALRADLEKRFVALLGPGTSRATKEYVCRKLSLIGTPASVPALAALLADAAESHMARFALERMAAPEAGVALREALGRVSGDLKIGVVGSLAKRRDAECVPLIAPLLTADPKTAAAAAAALGIIGSEAAIESLEKADAAAGNAVAAAVADGRLACAEKLLAAGKRAAALAAYRSLATAAAGKPAAKQIELAATRGVLACMDATASS
ncbi:MAG: HEAT repeat domain-containing protein [Pirellulales bacterium]